MENLCKGLLIGMIAGTVIGAVAVVKNKCLRDKVKQGVSCAEDKFGEVVDAIEKKIEEKENKSKNDSETQESGRYETGGCNDFESSKKSKK